MAQSADLSSHLVVAFLTDMLAGGISGAVSKTVSAPLERVKLLMQTQKLNPVLEKNPYSSPVDCIKRIYREEGLRAFWRGNMASIYRYFPNHALNFAFKDQYKRMFAPLLPPDLEEKYHLGATMVNNILAGGVAGGMALLVCHPFDVARTKLAADCGVDADSGQRRSTRPAQLRQYRGTLHCLQATYHQQGVRGLYAGGPVSFVGAVVYRGLHFGLYDTLKEASRSKDSLFFRFLAAQAVSLVVGVVVYPLDTVRRRMMVQNQHFVTYERRMYRHSFHCVASMLRNEGVRSFFAGLSVNLFRSISAAFLLVFYDELKVILQPVTTSMPDSSSQS